jgi:hypothetical protein
MKGGESVIFCNSDEKKTTISKFQNSREKKRNPDNRKTRERKKRMIHIRRFSSIEKYEKHPENYEEKILFWIVRT